MQHPQGHAHSQSQGQDYPSYGEEAANYSYPPQGRPTDGYLHPSGDPNNTDDHTLFRQPSSQSDATAYDEKVNFNDGTSKEFLPSPTSPDYYGNINNGAVNDDPDFIPPAIPRHPRPSSQFQPGHVSRGSVALLAAAEGKIPKKEGLKMWRKDEHHGTFTRGGKGRTCLRCTICTLLVAIVILLGVIAAFLLWVRPPNVEFKGVLPPQDGTSQLSLQSNGFELSFDLDIAVSNPNFFGASFKQISAKAYYPTNADQQLGGGKLDDVHIPAHSLSTVYFPFRLNYTTAIDPGSLILQDIATKCGFIGGQTSDIKVNYDLTLDLKVVAFTISPTFSSSTSFACPLKESDIQGLLGDSALGGLLGGSSS